MSTPNTRLKKLLSELSPSTSESPQTIGTLELGGMTYDVPASLDPTRLPHCNTSAYLDVRGGFNYDGLHFMLQKFLLGQDVFLLSQPGPYARWLVMTFCRWIEVPASRTFCGLTPFSMINSEYEYIALHRDVGETELKQGREIRKGGTLGYVDSAAVRAVKHGRILILEGVEKAERGIMPVGARIFDRKRGFDTNSYDLGAEQPIREPGNVSIQPLHTTPRRLVTVTSMMEHILSTLTATNC